jgi:hypothetical protein
MALFLLETKETVPRCARKKPCRKKIIFMHYFF